MRLRLFVLLLSLLPALAPAQALVVSTNPPTDMVELCVIRPDIRLDIRYATTNNFMGRVLYSAPKCYVRRNTARKLVAVQKDLAAMGLGLKVHDAYRPYRVTQKMWDLIHDDRYVADPAKGSKHNRGAAVDVTLVTRDGKDVPMPTPYDDFTEKAHWEYMDLPPAALGNRALLRYVMVKHGFEAVSTEWWHFNDTAWEQFPLLDVDFADIPTPTPEVPDVVGTTGGIPSR